jgi:peptidoglycan hydrolase-like protein with peptidoglycan-binding domain
MKILQFPSSILLLLLAIAALAPAARAVSIPALTERPSFSAPSAQLISQTPEVLMLGDSGTEVGDLQQNLSILGYFSDTITDYFGSATEDAVRSFQQDAGQPVDGVVGPSTLNAILQQVGSASSAPSDALRIDDTGVQVSELQSRLIDLGYFDGPSTGFFGSQTQSAVINFQQANGIAADGIVGRDTAEALRQSQ